jgi:hypothetical protein
LQNSIPQIIAKKLFYLTLIDKATLGKYLMFDRSGSQMCSNSLTKPISIGKYAHRARRDRRGGGGHLMYPLKRLQKIG